ncbi:hypothetical protein EN813_050490, partial [Mesorhizobium sp. M00.F.Ca.ET.170.01.1.1]
GATGVQRGHRLRDEVDALGFRLIPLTLPRSRRIVTQTKADNSIGEQRAVTPRLAPVGAAGTDVTPSGFGGSSMSGAHGSFVRSHRGRLRRAITASSGILALALSRGLWIGGVAKAQETQIIYPGSMAITGFPGTV